MDKNTWIGFGLIAAIIIGFSFFNRPSKEELAARQRMQDSIALVQAMEAEATRLAEQLTQQQAQAAEEGTTLSEETIAEQMTALYGPFAPAAQGQEGLVTLENSKLRIGIARRGGVVAKAELKDYKAYACCNDIANVIAQKSF